MSRGLIASSVLHVGLFLLFLAGPAPKAFEWEPKDVIPVDLVAPAPKLPETPPARPPETRPAPKPRPTPPVTQPEPEPEPEKAVEEPPAEKTPPPDPAPVKAAKPKPQPVLKKVAPRKEQDSGPSLAERLRRKLETATPAADTPPEVAEAPESAETPAPASSSTEVEATDFPFAWYLNTVRNKVLSAWDPPGERLLHGNVVLVSFTIHRDGRVTGVATDGASGTPGLDVSAMRAVERAQPFPPLPDAWDSDTLELTIRFTARGGSG